LLILIKVKNEQVPKQRTSKNNCFASRKLTLGVKAFLIITGVAVFFAWLPDGMSTLLDKIFGGEIFSWSTKDGTMLVQILGSIAIFLLVTKKYC